MDWITNNWPTALAAAAAVYFAFQRFRPATVTAEPAELQPLPQPVETPTRELTRQDIRNIALDAMSTAETHGKVCEFIEIVNEAKPLFDCCEGKDDTSAAE